MLFCQLWSCGVLIGVGMLTQIRKCTLQLVCLELILCMPKSIISDHIYLGIYKTICCMCVVGGLPLVDIVILGTDCCWHAGTDKELHLSSTDGSNTQHVCIYWVGFHIILTIHYPHILGHSNVKVEYRSNLVDQLSYSYVCVLFVSASHL